MIIANQWYNIAKTSTLGSTTGIRIEFGSYYALVRTAVDYGNIVITAVESNIGEEKIKVGVRIRYNRGWFADVRISPTIDDADLKASVYENNGWTAVSPNTSTAGSTVCIINDVISQMLPSSGGESLWERVNVGTKEEPKYALVPKEYDGFKPGIVTHTFVTFGGMGSGATGEGGTGNGAVILDGLEDVQIISPTPGQILTYDEITGLWINKSTDFVTQQYVDDAINPLSDRVTELEKYFYFDKERNAVCVKEDYNFIVPKYITFGGLDTGSGEGGGGLSRVTIYLGETPYTSETGVVRLPAYPVIPTDISAFNNDKAYATVTEVNNAISTAISHLSGNINTLQDNISTLQSYFTNGAANNALMLGGQLPEYYATNSALTALSDRVTELEKLFYFDAERNAVRTSLSLIVDQWLTFGGAAMGSGSVTGATTLAALNDVHIIDPADGQFLVYDATQGLWVNKTGGVSGDYLPLSGGTIKGRLTITTESGTDYTDVNVVRNGMMAYMGIQGTQGALFGYVGASGDSKGLIVDSSGLIYDDNNTQYKLIHSGNIGQYITGGGTTCLPLSGGTMNDEARIVFRGNNSYGSSQWQVFSYGPTFQIKSADYGSSGYYMGLQINKDGIVSLRNGDNGRAARIHPNGGMQFYGGTSGWAMGIEYYHNNGTYIGNAAGALGNNNTFLHYFYGGNYNNAAMYIKQNGNVLIGTTTDNGEERLQVPGSYIYCQGLHSSQGGYIWWNDSGIHLNPTAGDTYNALNIFNNGNVVIGTPTDIGGKLQVSGRASITNGAGSSSISGDAFNLVVGSTESAMMYNTGIALCGLHHYRGTTTYANHAHAWIGLGPYLDLTGPEVYPFVIATNSSTTTGAAPVVRLMINPLTGVTTVYGNFVATGAVTFNLASDRRLKSNIRPLTYRNTMRVLHRLRPVSFEWNDIAVELDSSRQGLCDGFIADEYEALIPNSGSNIWEKYRAIDYTRAIPYLAKGWQIHESELDKMRKKVKTMERRIEHLEKILVEHNIIAA